MASIDKRPNGTWRARWREYPGGPQRTKAFPRKIDAERYLVEVQHQLARGTYIRPADLKLTVGDYWSTWSARQPWRTSTRERASLNYDKHIAPTFKHRPLTSIRRGDIEDWGQSLPLAASTAGLVISLFSAMLRSAVDDELLAANPALRAKRPTVEHGLVQPLTRPQIEALRAALPPWARVAVTLGAGAGLRFGEAAGLTVDRVDFLRRELVVDRQVVLSRSGRPTLAPPKTRRSFRTVPLPEVVVIALGRHLELHPPTTEGLILHGTGEPLNRSTFDKRWTRARAAAGLPGTKYHHLRHTYASNLLSGGVSVAAVADWLGHTPAVLLRTYAHVIPKDTARARAIVQEALTGQAEDSLRTGTSI